MTTEITRGAEVTIGVDENSGRVLMMELVFHEPMTRSETAGWLLAFSKVLKVDE